ncbi:hypothetical protein B0H13DRAFT_2375790 [Mycena leptocephala]|nr:hypothetical protein B0H13DRAFT_2375790 [Mycena leptocephala]
MSEDTIPPLDGTVGSIEIGLIVSTVLFGVVTLQTFNYYRNYLEDSSGLKILVALVWCLEVGHSVCGWHGVYSMTVTFYGQPKHISDPPISLVYLPVFSSVLITLVQGFFCVRIGRLSGRWNLARICFLFSAIPFVLTITIISMYHDPNGGFIKIQKGLGRVLLVITTALQPPAHILIAAALCYHLWLFRDSNHSMKVQTIVDKLIIWSFLTRQDLAWMAFYLVQSKLLSNTMMTS